MATDDSKETEPRDLWMDELNRISREQTLNIFSPSSSSERQFLMFYYCVFGILKYLSGDKFGYFVFFLSQCSSDGRIA